MGRIYNLSIRNESGAPRNYSLVPEPPFISNNVTLFSNVQQTASRVPPGGYADMVTSTNYYAFCGDAREGFRTGAKVNIFDLRPIDLCGERGLGTTLLLKCNEGTFLSWADEDRNSQNRGSWQCRTASDFSHGDAENKNFVVGIAADTGRGEPRPVASFMPHPDETYIIYPGGRLCIYSGDNLAQGSLCDVKRLRDVLWLDTRGLPDRATIVHTQDGRLELQ